MPEAHAYYQHHLIFCCPLRGVRTELAKVAASKTMALEATSLVPRGTHKTRPPPSTPPVVLWWQAHLKPSSGQRKRPAGKQEERVKRGQRDDSAAVAAQCGSAVG